MRLALSVLGRAALATTLCAAALLVPGDVAATAAPAARAASRATAQVITPEGVFAQDGAQATDRQGDTAYFYSLGTQPDASLNLRIRRADGTLLPGSEVSPMPVDAFAANRVGVDRRGNGVVAWEQVPIGGDEHPRLMARTFDRAGRLGPLVQVSPPDHWASGVEVAVQPGGTAVVTWTRIIDNGYEPWLRLLAPDGSLGTPQRVGEGPNGQAPLVAMSRTGRATLVWSDTHLYARHVSPSGRMGPTKRLRRASHLDESLTPSDLGMDRRGVFVAAGTGWTPNTATYPQQDNSHEITAWWRISPRLRLMAPVRMFAPRKETLDHVDVAVSESGGAVLGWQRNYYQGAFVRLVAPDGSVGRVHRLTDGGLGDIAVRPDGSGVVASSSHDAEGRLSVAWATPLRGGRTGTSRPVGRSDFDISYLQAGVGDAGGALVTWAEELGNARIVSVAVRAR
jgi:hypothetical protein